MSESRSIIINGKTYSSTAGQSRIRSMDLQPRRVTPAQAQTPKVHAPKNTSRQNKSTQVHPSQRVHTKVSAPTRRSAINVATHIRPLKANTTQPVRINRARPHAEVLGQAQRTQRVERALRFKKDQSISKFGPNAPTPAQQLVKPELREEPPEVPALAVPPNAYQAKKRMDAKTYIAAKHRRASSPAPKTLGTIALNSRPDKQQEPSGSSKLARFASVAACGMLLLGYFAYLNIPNLTLRVAASRAGIEASLPGYNPGGFGLSGPIAYSDGQLVLSFSSRTDERAYKLIQTRSEWDSQSLANNYLDEANQEYTTVEDRGLTIYLFSGSNATWVNRGVWYTIQGDGSFLSETELVDIAASI